ncbi:MAG TPA: Y-family DNA polymerase [Methylophilus sp.]|uniref:Y-family DNA polymerase n=1 Tax=Methylophilus sp. TaxID=29541 RepID=UPI002B89C682|nr:Y-family DNA polymerase [Methylophilus sp.]HSH85769.1 Y-family DNA polymerase [Methylophilus sp.]
MSLPSRYDRVFGHIDGHSFYANCERIYRPDLAGKPVVVLSNNDGCVIAQSREAKAVLELYMCRPWFEVKEEAEKHGVVAFSSNYELYADASNRFMQTLREFAPRIEVYSIDESFIDMTGYKGNLTAHGREMRDTVEQWARIPCGVGYGRTKTLAKLANHCAKKMPRFNEVCDLVTMPEAELNSIMESLKLSDVWGIGKRLEKRMNARGIHNVLKLKNADPKRIRDEFGVVVERTVKELNGEAHHELNEEMPDAKQVMSSRSFGKRVSTLKELKEAISFHASTATARMREKGLYANAVMVFIQNSPFDEAEYYGASRVVGLPAPIDNTLQINNVALEILKVLFKKDIYYQKCGVMLTELVPATGKQSDMFGFVEGDAKADALMSVMDSINSKYSRGTIKLASEGVHKAWSMKRELKSPNFASWEELPQVRA